MNHINFTLIILIMSLQLTNYNKPTERLMEKWKQEVITTEHNFLKMAEEKGISEAFQAYAADDAVLMRNDTIIKGKNNLKAFLSKYNNPNLEQSLKWEPDFVDVSSSGDLAYTYGNFILTYKDSLGKKVENKGIFHTVWKRQPNQEWKFVWD